MDPTVDVLTIYPAAWAALFQGLAEGLIYGLVGMATAAITATVLVVTMGNLRDGCRTDGPDGPLSAVSQPDADELSGVIRLAAVREERRQRSRGRSA